MKIFYIQSGEIVHVHYNTFMNTLTFKISRKFSGYRLDKYLGDRFNFRSRSWWQKQINSGTISLYEESKNGQYLPKEGNLKSSTNVTAGNICLINEIIFTKFRFKYNAEDLEIIYKDEFIVVVNKPAGLVVHPVNTMTKGALTCLLEERLKGKIFLCHRLDRLTSGIIVIARSNAAASEVSKQFRENKVKKTYEALVENSPLWNEKLIELPIGADEDSPIRLKMIAFTKEYKGNCKESVTNLKVLKKLHNFSIIEAKPETGRTHQIRVHLSALNLPVVKDKLYGSIPELDYFETGIANLTPYYPDWHGLHAKSIKFIHPQTKEIVSFQGKKGREMAAFIETIKKG